MSWNYRVMRMRDGPRTYLTVREVHYDEYSRPTAYTTEDATFGSEDAETATEILQSLCRATNSILSTPILDQSEFDKPLEERPPCPRSQP